MVGDWVFLKLQPYVQSSLSHRSDQKLSFRFFGPYRVVQRIGAVAYKLALPDSSAIHPVFHVSQLKASHGTKPVSQAIPTSAIDFQVPQRILQRRRTSRDHPMEQVLIQWSYMPASLATWEHLEALRQQFPCALAWGHVGSQERATASTVAHPATAHPEDTEAGDVEAEAGREPRAVRKEEAQH